MEMAPCREFSGCEFVVSGIGATATAIATARAIERFKPQLLIQIGIAGAIDTDIEIGEVVFVTEDYQADLGAWRNDSFFPFGTQRFDIPNPTQLRAVTARSTNTACVPYLRDSAQIESMEGAAFYNTAAAYGVPCYQIRAISNYTISDRSSWQIDKAVSALHSAMRSIIKQ